LRNRSRGTICLTQGTIDTREPRLNEKAMPRYSELGIDHGHHPSCDEDPPELERKPDKPLRMNPAVVGAVIDLVQTSTGLVCTEDRQKVPRSKVVPKMVGKSTVQNTSRAKGHETAFQ
jgi:hypothetical protein